MYQLRKNLADSVTIYDRGREHFRPPTYIGLVFPYGYQDQRFIFNRVNYMSNNNNCLACHTAEEFRRLQHAIEGMEKKVHIEHVAPTNCTRHTHQLSSIPCCNTANLCPQKNKYYHISTYFTFFRECDD